MGELTEVVAGPAITNTFPISPKVFDTVTFALTPSVVFKIVTLLDTFAFNKFVLLATVLLVTFALVVTVLLAAVLLVAVRSGDKTGVRTGDNRLDKSGMTVY